VNAKILSSLPLLIQNFVHAAASQGQENIPDHETSGIRIMIYKKLSDFIREIRQLNDLWNTTLALPAL
jgi:hypothetical protein